MSRFKTNQERREFEMASQEEVDERIRRCSHTYSWYLSKARDAEGDADVGELVCTVMRLMDDTDNMNFTYSDECLILWSDKELVDGLPELLGKHSKDVKEVLKHYQQMGIYDKPSRTH